jgi:hypothetical protein
MADTIAVHHAGPGESHGGYPRVKIWCDVVPNVALMRFFENIAEGIEGIDSVFPSECDHAHAELIIEPAVLVDATASKWIADVNRQLGEMEEDLLTKFFVPDPDVMASHSTTSTFHGADRSG